MSSTVVCTQHKRNGKKSDERTFRQGKAGELTDGGQKRRNQFKLMAGESWGRDREWGRKKRRKQRKGVGGKRERANAEETINNTSTQAMLLEPLMTKFSVRYRRKCLTLNVPRHPNMASVRSETIPNGAYSFTKVCCINNTDLPSRVSFGNITDATRRRIGCRYICTRENNKKNTPGLGFFKSGVQNTPL